jgi:hypothetical protein
VGTPARVIRIRKGDVDRAVGDETSHLC